MKRFLVVVRLLGVVLTGMFLTSAALAQKSISISVVDDTGSPISDYRWLLEEDNTTFHDPANPHGTINASHDNTLSVQFHKSYSPVLDAGCVGDSVQTETGTCASDGSLTIPNTGRYVLSVLPYDGHNITGLQINADKLAGGEAFQVMAPGKMNASTGNIELPSAQVSVFAFVDDAPLNNAWDDGEAPMVGASIVIEDAGGKFGASAGQLVSDVYGNPFGTTYQRNADGSFSGYDADGVPLVAQLGNGELKTGADGRIIIRNMAPGKYGITVRPPAGSGIPYQQTSTIEGTRINDVWLLPNETEFFQQFGGPQNYHVATGFVPATPLLSSYQTGGATVTGTVYSMHTPRPPNIEFNYGAVWNEYAPASPCWIGLNDLSIGTGQMIMAQECDGNSSFSIPNLKDGAYQIVVWDRFLDGIIGFFPLTVQNGQCSGNAVTFGTCDLGKVGLYAWFSRIDNYVFYDSNEDGKYDPATEPGIPEQAVNLRFRDGTIYQTFPTDLTGFVPFDQVFPFFHWLVAEVDFARFKATGVTVHVDDGGEIGANSNDPSNPYSNLMNPQIQADGASSRTDLQSVLTQGYQAFLGSVNVFEWGKANYGPNESGGISGIVYYAVTRAENDPTAAAAEPWEPGIPRVQMGLYQPCPDPGAVPNGATRPDRDDRCETVMDPETNSWVNGPRAKVANPGSIAFSNRLFVEPDVDNYPLNFRNCWQAGAPGCEIGPEDIDRNGNGVFDAQDAISVTWTDSWDDNLPTDCPPSKLQVDAGTANTTQAPFVGHIGTADEFNAGSCFDGQRPFNQVRPEVFDGGFAFEDFNPEGARRRALGGDTPLVSGDYIVQAFTPPNLKPLTAQAKNVDFGAAFGANTNGFNITPAALPFDCAGPKYKVPDFLTLFPGVPAPLGGTYQNLCDMRSVVLSTGLSGGGQNAGAEFWMYTDVPKAARIVGVALDDLANVQDPANPVFGEKYAPPFLPIAIRDYTGTEIARVYTDEFGAYNALVPSTFSANVPSQSGMSPNMLQACINDPVKPDGTFDPAFKREYGEVCWTLQYMPGSTTYLDTPILRLSAFASNTAFPLDCECSDETPVIHHVENGGGTGTVTYNPNETFTVISMGDTLVPNPDYDRNVQPAEITRDFGFGSTAGVVTVGGVVQTNVVWTNDMITFTRETGTPETGDLVITRANGKKTEVGVQIVYVDAAANPDVSVLTVSQGASIQDAIDAASPGDIVLVKSGRYDESLILTKNIRLQGVGARGTVINGRLSPTSRVVAWQSDIAARVASGEISLLPNQTFATVPEVLLTEVGAPLSVFGRELAGTIAPDSDFTGAYADGFSFESGQNGGGVLINGYAPGFTLSNDIIAYNRGDFGGGVRVGSPGPTVDPMNDNFVLRNSRIIQNGGGNDVSSEGAGGVAIYAGADGYLVSENTICGNFAVANGGGIGHVGLSDGGRIINNRILFNQSFNQQQAANGGGLYISGTALVGEPATSGAGNVEIVGNLIQGNQAGAGDGGAFATFGFNGDDAIDGDGIATYRLSFINNTVVNNVTGGAGTIALQDVELGDFFHNTIAYNDSTATAATAFTGPNGFSESVNQVSGIYSKLHGATLLSALGVASGNSNPDLLNNIIWHNRSCHWSDTAGVICDVAGTTTYDELGVQGNAACLNVDYSVLSDVADADICLPAAPDVLSNVQAAPDFIGPSFLTAPSAEGFAGEAVPVVQAFAALDEGGNFIDLNFGLVSVVDLGGQLTPKGDFHLYYGSPAMDMGTNTGVLTDIDGDMRPMGVAPDAGSDEIQSGLVQNTIAITQAAVTAQLSNNRVRVAIAATSDFGPNANLTFTLLESLGRPIAQDSSLYWDVGLNAWSRTIRFSMNGRDYPLALTVMGAEGSATTSITAP